jgi:hypothetical protein
MKPRTFVVSVACCLVSVVAASTALASAPTRTELPTGSVVIPDSLTSCGFDVLADTFISGGVEKDFVDSSGTVTRILITGRFVATYTNLSDPSQSITLNVSGPSRILLYPDGSFTYIANGPQGFFTGSDLLYNKGHIVADVSAAGDQDIDVTGHTISLCEVLSS